MALIDELLAATSPAEILRHVARATWAKAHDGAECPDKRLPAPADLAAWLPECRALERLAAADAMDTVVRTLAVHDEPSRKLVPALTNLDRLIAMVNRLAPPEIAHVTAADLSAVDRAALVHRSVLLGAIFPSWSTPAGEATTIANLFRHWLTDPEHEGDGKTLLGTERVHALWVEARKHDADLRHPLTPLVDAWQGRPVNVDPETRADRRIMPTWRVTGPAPERERGILFGGLVEDRPRVVDLPLFPELEPTRPRVSLLEIVDATGVPLRSPGHGAPIEARLIVRGGLLMIRPEDRGCITVRIAVKVCELLDGLYPRPTRPDGSVPKRRTAQHWPKIKAALRVTRDFTVPDATGGRWFPMALRRLPAEHPNGTPALDDLVVIDLAPPPGAATGATVDLPALDLMGVSSGPEWYAYIAARSLVWIPGKTRRPVPKGGGQWGWSADPNDYPVLTLADKRRFSYGANDKKHRTQAAINEPWSNLPDVVLAPNQTDARTGVRGERLLPAEARRAFANLERANRPRET